MGRQPCACARIPGGCSGHVDPLTAEALGSRLCDPCEADGCPEHEEQR